MVTTPISYFAAYHLDTQCSVMVTGSHNPPDYNGLKMVIAGDTLAGDESRRSRRASSRAPCAMRGRQRAQRRHRGRVPGTGSSVTCGWHDR